MAVALRVATKGSACRASVCCPRALPSMHLCGTYTLTSMHAENTKGGQHPLNCLPVLNLLSGQLISSLFALMLGPFKALHQATSIRVTSTSSKKYSILSFFTDRLCCCCCCSCSLRLGPDPAPGQPQWRAAGRQTHHTLKSAQAHVCQALTTVCAAVVAHAV